MASEHDQSNGNQTAPVDRVPRPPPKPHRPRIGLDAPDDDPTTIRVALDALAPQEAGVEQHRIVTLEAAVPAEPPPLPAVAATSDPEASSAPAHRPLPPPLPGASKPSERTPTVALEIPTHLTAARPGFFAGRYAKIGAGLFGAGVLVGIVGSVVVLTSGDDTPKVVTAPTASAREAPKVAALARPKEPTIEQVTARDLPAEAKAEPSAPRAAEASTPKMSEPPISSSRAPSCKEMLGKSLVERHDPKAAARETAIGKRELVRGNVAEAQAAYCKARAWDRRNAERHVNLARLFLVRRDWEKAAEFGKRALELDPKSRSAQGVLADAWAALHKTKEARAALLAAEAKPQPSESELALIVRRDMALARRVERLRDFSLAERLYRRVLLVEPEHAGAMKGIASCLRRIGDPKAADAWARRADVQTKSAAS